MKKFGNFIVRNKKWIIIFFALLIIPSAIGNFITDIDYDMTSYLPGELNSVKGNEILSEEFGLSDTIYLLVQNRELWEIVELEKEIQQIKGVNEINWIDDFTDINVPVDFIPQDIKNQFVSGESTILQIQINSDPGLINDYQTIEQINEIAGDEAFLGGQPVLSNEFKDTVSKEKIIYVIIAFIVIFIILSLSTTSFIEPVVLLLAVGMAIILNLGTNAFIGKISYMTASIAAIIQLGVSMDYSIFLLHRYHEEKKRNISKEEAMITAISKTGMVVAASVLTTVAGFAALMIMRIGIGKDLGFVMAKGVILSLITTMTLLPCLILIFDKLIEKKKHRIFLPRFNLISRWIVKARWVFLVLIVILIVPSFMAQKNLDFYTSTASSLPENASSVEATEKIKQEFGTGEVIYLITADEGVIKEKQLIDKIKTITEVDSVSSISEAVDISIPDTFVPDELIDQFRESGYGYCSIQLTTGIEDIKTAEAIEQIKDFTSGTYDEWYLTGEAVMQKDLAEISKTDLKYVTILSMVLIALIIAISFRSLSIPVILIMVIQLAIWINLSIPYF
ncbi:MAG: MMPL family transporter, partial [Actinomycetota bacterium]|nr:MMPL family transporter [Actinomycetota bacterium]